MRLASYRFILLAATLLLAAGPGAAQTLSPEYGTGRLQMTRAELQDLLGRYEALASSPARDKVLQERARYEAALIRARLDTGDFQVGDRIDLVVEGEPTLSTTFAVVSGNVLRLPAIGDVSLGGVLRSELEPHLVGVIGRYLKTPVVQARALIRISVLGSVANPGFFMVPADALLTDVLMTAGGPDQNAKLTKVRVERGKERIWQGDPLQQAITEGRTLDQLSLRAGDRVIIPSAPRVDWYHALGAGAIVVSGVVAVVRLF